MEDETYQQAEKGSLLRGAVPPDGGAPPEPSAWVTLREMVAFDSRDWSVSPKDAMLYGIIVGWDAPALAELAEIHGWDERFRNRLAALHDDYMALRVRAASRPGT
jgi:hypothetical protein